MTHMYPLKIVQKYVIKIILNKQKSYPSHLLFDNKNFFDVDTIYIFSNLTFLKKRPDLTRPIEHNYATRAAENNNVTILKSNKTAVIKFFDTIAMKLYNLLPRHIKEINHNYMFKNKMKLFVTQNLELFKNLMNS